MQNQSVDGEDAALPLAANLKTQGDESPSPSPSPRMRDSTPQPLAMASQLANMQKSAPQSISTKFIGLRSNSKFADQNNSGCLDLVEGAKAATADDQSQSQETLQGRHNRSHTHPALAGQSQADAPSFGDDRENRNKSQVTEYGVIHEQQPQSSTIPDELTQKKLVCASMATMSDAANDATSLISNPVVPSLANRRNQPHTFSYDYEQVGGVTAKAFDRNANIASVTEQTSRFQPSGNDQQNDDSNFQSCTELAPSENGLLAVSQTGVIKVQLSDEDELIQQTVEHTQQSNTTAAFETTFRPTAEAALEPNQNLLGSIDDEGDAQGKAPIVDSPNHNKFDQLDQNQDSVLTVAAKATQLARSQEAVVSHHEGILTPVSELQSPFDSIRDSGRPAIGVESSQAAASDQTEKDKDQEQRDRKKFIGVLNKESANGLSSENSHQNTRSAVDKGNLVQRDTDPSEGRPINEDSQQSSHMSQYFHQIELQEHDRVSISKEIILENDEDCDSGVNADLMHLNQLPLQPGSTHIPASSQGLLTTETVPERSNETTEMHALSSPNLEYSKSINATENPDTVAGTLDQIPAAVSNDENEEEKCDEVPWSLKGSARNATGSIQTNPALIEKTPQFQTASPIHREATNAAEESITNQQQVNYESDKEGIAKSTGRVNHNSKAQAHEEQKINDKDSVSIDVQTRNQKHESSAPDIYAPNQTFVLNQTLSILNSNSMYDPKNHTPKVLSNASLADGQIFQGTQDIIKIVQDGGSDLENKDQQTGVEGRHRDRYRNSINEYQAAPEPQPQVESQTSELMRGSTRFSKGFNDELDRVADQIQNSFALNANSSIAGESLSIGPEQDQRMGGKIQHTYDENQPYENEQPINVRGSHETSSLPRHARSITKRSSNNSTTLSKNTKKQHRKQTLEAKENRAAAAEINMLVREQETPGSGDNSSTIQSRRNSHLNEPRFPEPVDEARQRYSTPRREAGNRSPISQKNSMTSGSQGRGGASKGITSRQYPVEIRKRQVIKGPVLREHADQHATIKNGKLKLGQRSKRNGKKNGQNSSSNIQQAQNTNTNTITDDSLMMSSTRQARKGAQSRTFKKGAKAIQSSDSLSLSRSNGEQSSICLPKRRIKKKGTGRVQSNEMPVNQSNSLETTTLERKPAVPKQAKINNALLNAKNDARMGVGKRRKDTNSVASKYAKTQQHQASQNANNRKMKGQQGYHNAANTSMSEIQDLSLISGPLQNQKSDIQFDKKVTPRYPMAVTLDNSSIDFAESNFRTNTLQTSQQAISDMPIDQIYQQLSKNWNKDMIMFQQRCQQVLEESKHEADVSQILSSEEVRSRKQRFELLKQRLLDNQAAAKGRKKLGEQLQQQQNQINQNLKELDTMFNNQDSKKDKLRQIGQFQLIFNKPMERFNMPPLPSSPTHQNPPPAFLKREHPISAHQSQIQLRHGRIGLAGQNCIQTRQRSQVLSPKITSSFLDSTVNSQQVMAMNSTPVQNVGLLEKKMMNEGQSKFFDNQSKSLNTTTLVNFKSGRAKYNDYSGQAPKMPTMQFIRAATANNASKKRGSNLTETFNSSIGFKSSASMAKRNLRMMTNKPAALDTASNLPELSPQSAGADQTRLMQKLQYRSMRGRRIKEFLKHVQSQKIRHEVTCTNSSVKPEQEYQDFAGGGHIGGGISSYPQSDLNNTMTQHTYEQPPQLHSQSSMQRQNEDYSGRDPQKQLLSNKLKGPWSGAQGGANQSDGGTNSQNSINQMESQTNGAWLSNQKGKELQSFNSNELAQSQPKAQVTSSALLNSFLAEQDKRIDFYFSMLNRRIREGETLDLDATDGENVLNVEQLESLMNLIKRKNQQTMTKQFQLRSHQDCFNTIQHLLNELGMGYRARRMQRDEAQIDIERVYIMACRAHKLFRARAELIDIFKMIDALEEMLPRVKQSVMGKLAVSSSKAASSRSGPLSGDGTNNSVVNLEDNGQGELQAKSTELKKVLSKLVVSIPTLLRNYKFFNNSFVFNDKDYLKYLSKEFIEIKGLLSVYNVHF